MSETVLEIWTDGACKFNPGPGGWGVLMVYGGHRRELCGGARETTNNRMELRAVIEALRAVKRDCPMKIHLDSSYVKDGITKWIHGWKKKGWKKEGKTPIKNIELWQCLDRERNRFTQIEWCWVKGHAGNPGNEKADELANTGVAGVLAGTIPEDIPIGSAAAEGSLL